MAGRGPAKSKTDAVTRMIQKARLQTDFSDGSFDVRHTIRNHAAPGSSLHEFWEYKKCIGRGGFGSVHLERCRDVDVLWDDSEYEDEGDDGGATDNIGSLRAVKQLSKPHGQKKLSGELLRELHSLVFFSKPKYGYHFVKTYGWYESKRTLYIAMEYVRLGDLQTRLVDRGPLEEVDVKSIVKQVLHGLKFMHDEGFVHRDVKPSNLLIEEMPPYGTWWIKISDFGLSKKIEQSRMLSSTVCGTLGFMAPELLGFKTTRNELSHFDKWKAADIWAIGETVHQLLTGVASFGDNISSFCDYIRNQKSFPQEALEKTNITTDGIAFIRRCMAPDPGDRPPAGFALKRLGWLNTDTDRKEKHRDIAADTICTIGCYGSQPPFILFSPKGDHLVVIETTRVFVWDIKSKSIGKIYVGKEDATFCHASIHPKGKYICITQSRPRDALILDDAINLTSAYEITADFGDKGAHPTISAFSPDGRTLVLGRNYVLCQVKLRKTGIYAGNYFFVLPMPRFEPRENKIKDMRFTKDGSRLIAACVEKLVIMDTTTNSWFRTQVIEYPCSASSLHISPGSNMVACGSTTGEPWLWILETSTWARMEMSSGDPDATSGSVENLRFSATGDSVSYNLGGSSCVKMSQTTLLDRTRLVMDFKSEPGRRIGHSLMNPRQGVGATAVYGPRGADVIFWKFVL